MKTKKRLSALFAILLVVAFAVSGTVITNTQVSAFDDIILVEDLFQDAELMEAITNDIALRYGEDIWSNLAQAHENRDQLFSVFAGNSRNQDGEEPNYPDFIGGIYFNDPGNMVLQIVNNSSGRSSINDFLREAENVIVEYVDFSQNELNAILDVLDSYRFAIDDVRPEVFNNIDWYALDTINNRVEVHLRVYNEREIARFRDTVLDSPAIYFVESVSSPVAATTLFAGQDMRHVFGGSLGYRVERGSGCNTVQGFVTTGHAGLRVGQTLPFGTVRWWQWSGQVDAAFIETNSNVNLSNTLANNAGWIVTNVPTSFAVGDIVAKLGGTTGYTTGRVTRANVEGAGVTGQVQTDVNADFGDSGGIVIAFVPRDPPRQPWTAGIVQAVHVNHNGHTIPNTMIFCRADRINAAGGLTRF